MIADETPPEIRGRAFGLRQSLDTVGALLAPIAAIGLMALFAERHPRGLLGRGRSRPACSFLLAWLALREPEQHLDRAKRSPFFGGFRDLDSATKRLLAVGFLFALARFSEAFLILKGIEVGLSRNAVAADARAVQSRLCRAGLSRRRAERPDEPQERS